MTRLQARQILRDHGMTLTGVRDNVDGFQYCVNFEDGEPHEAYYARDLFDAIDTGIEMALEANVVNEEEAI